MRFIEWQGQQWIVSHLAREHGINPGTFHGRLHRFGETTTGIARALATGVLSPSERGLLGKQKSPWRFTS